MKAYQFTLRSQPIVALCGKTCDFPGLIAALDTSGPRRRVLRHILLLVARLRLVPLIARGLDRSDWEHINAIAQPMYRTADNQGVIVRSFSVVWPTGDRAHRRYIFGIDNTGAMRFFSKVTTLLDLDWRFLKKESELLSELETNHVPRFRTPKVYLAERGEYLGALVLEAIPARRRHLGWPEIYRTLPLNQGLCSALPRDTGKWLEAASGTRMSDGFRSLIREGIDRPSTIGLVHGDVRPSNVVQTDDETWLFDWELGDRNGPLNADLVAAFLNSKTSRAEPQHASVILRSLREATARFAIDEVDTALCLLYLSTVGHSWATLLIREDWSISAQTTSKGSVS